MPYEIPNTAIDIELAVESLDRLYLHEHVVTEHQERLASAIETDGTLLDPIIIDRTSGVVLDGMHRLTSLAQLGYTSIPTARVEYDDPQIAVERWVKLYDATASTVISTACDTAGIDIIEAPPTEGDPRPELYLSGDRYLLDVPLNPTATYCDRMHTLFSMLLDRGHDPTLIADSNLEWTGVADAAAIVQPVIDKELVVATATRGIRFPPNTSRHIIPTRPVGVNVPLKFLSEDHETADQLLTDFLLDRTIRAIDRGDVHDGRVYDETLITFE